MQRKERSLSPEAERPLRHFGSVFALALLLAINARAPGQGPPAIVPGSITVRLELFSDGLTNSDGLPPTDFAQLDDGSGRILVSTLTGPVRLLDSSGNHLDSLNNPFIDASAYLAGQYGSTGIAVHPDYAANGKIYLLVPEQVTRVTPPPDFPSPDGATHHEVLVEWTAADPASSHPTFTRRDVMRFELGGVQHGIFDLAFNSAANRGDADYGLLYLFSGDGGVNGLRSQEFSNHHGAVIRIDPVNASGPGLMTSANGKYGIPLDNAGVGTPNDGVLDEAIAFGFRSPYRFNFDSVTGRLYEGDVGAGAYEEINLVENGSNYGWPAREGSGSTSGGYTNPIFAYGRADGETVVGGFVYRGSQMPELYGKYVWADFGLQASADTSQTPARLFYGSIDTATGEIIDASVRAFQIDSLGDTTLVQQDHQGNLILNEFGDPASNLFIYSIGEDLDRELYLLVADRDNRSDATASIFKLGIPTLAPDFDLDGDVDNDDLAKWERNFGLSEDADANKDGISNGKDFLIWQQRFGIDTSAISTSVRVPELDAQVLFLATVACLVFARWSRQCNLPVQQPGHDSGTDQPAGVLVNGLNQCEILEERLIVWGARVGSTSFNPGNIPCEVSSSSGIVSIALLMCTVVWSATF